MYSVAVSLVFLTKMAVLTVVLTVVLTECWLSVDCSVDCSAHWDHCHWGLSRAVGGLSQTTTKCELHTMGACWDSQSQAFCHSKLHAHAMFCTREPFMKVCLRLPVGASLGKTKARCEAPDQVLCHTRKGERQAQMERTVLDIRSLKKAVSLVPS